MTFGPAISRFFTRWHTIVPTRLAKDLARSASVRSGRSRVQRKRLVCGCALTLCYITIVSCSPPQDRNGAIAQVAGQGLLNPDLQPGLLPLGVGQITEMHIAESQTPCEGAIGSLIPPFALRQCSSSGLADIVLAPVQILDALTGHPWTNSSPPTRHVMLNGIERFWVHQSQDNDCWAASLQTARDYLNLHHVSQDDMIDASRRVCPRLRDQGGGADAYQIMYAIRSTLKSYDSSRVSPAVCLKEQCIIDRLTHGHPLIMLGTGSGGGHAILIVGADYYIAQGTRTSSLIIDKLYILDPNGVGQVEVRSDTVFCHADAFIAY